MLARLGAAACAATAWPARAGIPFKPEQAEGPTAQGWGLALLACTVALVVLLVLARRFAPRLARGLGAPAAQGAAVRVVSTTRLTPQVQLAVVEFDGRQLLLSVNGGAATLLSESKAISAPEAGA